MRAAGLLRFGPGKRWVLALSLLVVVGLYGALYVGLYTSLRPQPMSFRLKPVAPLESAPVAEIGPPPAEGAPLQSLAAWVRPRPEEYRWLTLPWQTSIVQALQLAKQTNRLVFLWGTNLPTGRC
jgi:hypothetical protein